MRYFPQIIAAALLITISGSAAAQFGNFSLPSVPGLSKGGNKGVDTGSVISNVGKMTKDMTDEEEIAVGQEIASILLGAKPLLNNPGMQRYVNHLGRWLASQTERPDLPWTFAVLQDSNYNAFAAPGGYIFITEGLLRRMRSEAELAGVLAHEIAHVLQRHHLAAIKKEGGVGLIADIVSAKTGGNKMLKDKLLGVGRKLITSGLGRDEEIEADRLGVVIAARAGYDPFGLPAALQILQGQKSTDGDFTQMFATHPTPADRINTLDATMSNKFDALPTSPGRPLSERLKEFSR